MGHSCCPSWNRFVTVWIQSVANLISTLDVGVTTDLESGSNLGKFGEHSMVNLVVKFGVNWCRFAIDLGSIIKESWH